MKIMHYSEAESKDFNTDAVKGVTGRVLLGKADGAENFCMRMFEVAEKGYSPKHTHDWEHEIFFHSGRGEILNQGKWTPVAQGHVVYIPNNEEHQIRNAGDEPLIFICLIPSGAPEL
jgi:quercetin dioxygenase-like cupin family protein